MGRKPEVSNAEVIEITELVDEESRHQRIQNDNYFPSSSTVDWPKEPVTLVPTRAQSVIALVYDIVLVAIPALLIVKTGFVLFAYHTDKYFAGDQIALVSDFTKRLIEINGQLITIFAIVFVTVLSTLVKRYALYKAQLGATVHELEQLQGSVSLPSTMKLIWSLRAFSMISLGLVLAWSFQYLGSQANKYEYQLVLSDGTLPKAFEVTLCGSGTTSMLDPNEGYTADIGGINADFRAAKKLFGDDFTGKRSRVQAGSDLYGQSLIPDFVDLLSTESVRNSISSKENTDGWNKVSKPFMTRSKVSVSMLGSAFVYLAKDCTDGNMGTLCSLNPYGSWQEQFRGNYIIPSGRYFNFSCGTPQLKPYSAFPKLTMVNQTVSFNMTNITGAEARDQNNVPLRSVNVWTRLYLNGSEAKSAVATCDITTIHYDLRVQCLDTGCYPTAMRFANNTDLATATTFDSPFGDDKFASTFFSNLLLSYGPELEPQTMTTIGNDLVKPQGLDMFEWAQATNEINPEYTTAQARLNKALRYNINTYYGVSQTDYESVVGCHGTKSTFEGYIYSPRYEISWPWLAVDFVSCGVLLAAAIVSILLRNRTLAPDILGAVSSLTRDNPYLDLPDNGTTLTGLERAMLLKNVMVRLADVSRPDEEVGKIALVRVDAGSRAVDSLRKTTKYA